MIGTGWRSVAGAAGLMMALAACGTGSAPVEVVSGEEVPAAMLISADLARDLVPEATVEPIETPEDPEGVVAPTAFARPERTQGPPGNPSAQTFADPPAPGRYPYRVIAEGAFGQQEDEFEIEIRAARSERGGRSQVQFWDIQGFPQEFQYLWAPDRLLLQRVRATGFDGSTQECTFDPPSLVMRLPLHVGATWTAEAECDGEQSSSRSEVLRTERVDVEGTPVDTFVIRAVARSGDQRVTSHTWYAPSVRLFVIFEQEQESEEIGTVKTVIEALSLRPAEA